MAMQDREIVRGTNASWDFSIVNEDGTAVDMTVATRSATLRIKTETGTTTKVSTTGDDCTWRTQASGLGTWTFTPAETLAIEKGKFQADVVYTDTASTPDTKRLIGEGATLTFLNPKLGSIA